jgi:hypothetical protein
MEREVEERGPEVAPSGLPSSKVLVDVETVKQVELLFDDPRRRELDDEPPLVAGEYRGFQILIEY